MEIKSNYYNIVNTPEGNYPPDDSYLVMPGPDHSYIGMHGPIVSITTPDVIKASTGVALSDLGLPNFVASYVVNGSYFAVPVTFGDSIPPFVQGVSGTYIFKGTVSPEPSPGVCNRNNLGVAQTVVVSPKMYQFWSFDKLPDISVASGTKLSSISLPTTVIVNSYDDYGTPHPETASVEWDSASWFPSESKASIGSYWIRGTVTLPADVSNANGELHVVQTVKAISK